MPAGHGQPGQARAGDHNPPRRRHFGTRWRQAWIANGTIADLVVVWARDTQDGQVKVFVVETPADGYEASVITGEVSLQWRVPAGEGVTEPRRGWA